MDQPIKTTIASSKGLSQKWKLQEGQLRRAFLGVGTVAFILIAWQVAATQGWVRDEFTSYPTEIARSLVNYFASGRGWVDARTSLTEFGIGFTLAVIVGVPLGILLGWSANFSAALDGLITFLYNTPRIALAPLFVLWFGLGVPSKVVVVFFTAVFPLIISAKSGISSTDPALLQMARSFRTPDLTILTRIVVPGSVPAISSGLRIAVGQGLMGVVLAEFIASTKGLGYTLLAAANTLNTSLVFVTVVVISVLGLTLTAVFRRIERYFDRWRV